MDPQRRPDGDSTVSSPDQPRPSSPQPDLGHQPGSPRLPQPVCEDLSDRPSDPLHASLGTRSTDVEASASSPLAGDRAPEPDRSGGGKLDRGQHGHSGISAARTSYVPQDHLMWNSASFEPDLKLTPEHSAGPPPNEAEIAAARELVAHRRADLIKAQQALARLERRQTSSTTAAAKTCPPCKYCTGLHPSFAGIGGCTKMKPCSICGGDHKAGARGEGHAKAMRKQKAAAAEARAESARAESSSSSSSSASSTPSSPRGAGDQGGIPEISSEVLQGERSREAPDPEPAPAPKAAPAQDSGRAAQDCVEAESKPATEPASDPPWIQVVRGGKRSAAQGKERTGHDPGPPKLAPQAQRFQVDITDPKRWQRFAADRQARQAKSRESEHKAKTDPRGHQHLDPGDFPHRGKPGCSRCGDSTPTQLCNKPKVFSTLQGPPDDDSYRNVYVCNICMKKKAAYAEIFTERKFLHSDVPINELPFPELDEALAEQHALSTIDADAWFDEHINSAAQDEDQYRRLLKKKTEARDDLQVAFENHVARVAAHVEILRVRCDEIKTAHQDGIREMLRSGLQFQAESNKYWKSCRSNLAACQLAEKLKGRPLTTS